MDNCLCNYTKSYLEHKQSHPDIEYPQSIPGIFRGLEPIEGGIETVEWLQAQKAFDVYILSAPSIMNPLSYTEKAQWVWDKFGKLFARRLILSPHKNLNKGDYLIDDNLSGKGQERFEGTLVHYGSQDFEDWQAVRSYFEKILSNLDTKLNSQA